MDDKRIRLDEIVKKYNIGHEEEELYELLWDKEWAEEKLTEIREKEWERLETLRAGIQTIQEHLTNLSHYLSQKRVELVDANETEGWME